MPVISRVQLHKAFLIFIRLFPEEIHAASAIHRSRSGIEFHQHHDHCYSPMNTGMRSGTIHTRFISCELR